MIRIPDYLYSLCMNIKTDTLLEVLEIVASKQAAVTIRSAKSVRILPPVWIHGLESTEYFSPVP